MKKKIITFIGLALFVGAVAFNVHMTNTNHQNNGIILENIEALASSVYVGCPCVHWPQWPIYCWDAYPELGKGEIVCD